MTRTINRDEFLKLVTRAPAGKGYTPEVLAKGLEQKGYTLGPGLEHYSATGGKPLVTTMGQQTITAKARSLVSDVNPGTAPLFDPNTGPFAQFARTPHPYDPIGDFKQTTGEIAGGVAEALPAGMSMLGAAAGAPAGPAGAVAGASAFGAAGQMGKNAIKRVLGTQPDQTMGQEVAGVAGQGAMGALSEVGGQVAVKALGKLAAPLKQQFNSELKAIYDKYNVPHTLSMVSKSPVAASAEALTSKSLFGSGLNNNLTKAGAGIDEVARNLVQDIGSTTDPTLAGRKIAEGADAFRAAHLAERDAAYRGAVKEMVHVKPQNMPFDQTKGLLRELIQKKQNAKSIIGDVPLLDRLQKILKNLEPDAEKTAPDVLEMANFSKEFRPQVFVDALDELRTMSEDPGLLATGVAGQLKKVKATMGNEFESFIEQHAPEAFKALKSADDKASQGYELLNGTAGQVIRQLKDAPTKLVQALINPRSADRIPGLYQVIGHDNIPAVQGAFASKLLREASDPASGLTGNKLNRVLSRYGESTVEAALGPDRLKILKDLAAMATGMQAGKKVAQGSQTAFLGKLSAISGTLFINPLITAKLVMADAAFSKLISSSVGVKWLSEGFKVPEAVNAGIKAGAQILPRAAASSVQQ